MAEEHNDPNTNPDDKTHTDDKGGKTYPQQDVNRMMAAKAKEYDEKYQAQIDELKKSFGSERDKWLAEGEKRAKMSADEKAKAEFADKQKAIDEREKAFQAKMDEFDRDRALSNTKEALIDADLPKDFANFLTDVDDDKRNANIKAFTDAFTKAVETAVDKRVAGTKTPDTGSTQPSTNSDLPKSRDEFYRLSLMKQQELLDGDNGDYIRKNYLGLNS